MTNRVASFVLDVHMSLSHTGLRGVALHHKLDLDKLVPGEFVLFCNAPFTAFKLFGCCNTYLYYREPHGHMLDPKALMRMVQCFDGLKFDYKAAVAERIMQRLGKDTRAAIVATQARAQKKAQAATH